ncbi:MAG: hypothetical protein AB7H93_12155 [Vicinamibacterales bacterium]
MTMDPGYTPPAPQTSAVAVASRTPKPPQVGDLLKFMTLFPEFRAASWDRWRKELKRIGPTTREFYCIKGRGGGGSRIAALMAAFYGTRAYKVVPGERIYVAVLAPDKKQSGVTFRYVVGLMRSVPALDALIVAESRESLELANGVVIEVITASAAAPRGRAYALAIIEEAAFLPTDDQSSNPDVELLRALRPALARVPGSLLAVVSSPYARKGILWDAWRKHHGQPDGAVVLMQASTAELNPLFDPAAIAAALDEDPASASAEYLAQFRTDVESWISREAIDGVVVVGRHELPRMPRTSYEGFADFAGGAAGGDSATLAISHWDTTTGKGIAVLDLLREVKPPFSPEQVCADFAAELLRYGIVTATADRWAGQFPVEQMRKHRITLRHSEKSKSELYRDLLPVINSGACELLDHSRLLAQLAGLERRTARGGRDSIDHAPGGRDDVANAVAGAIALAGVKGSGRASRPVLWG